jgi:hypothetical protein
MKRFAYFVNLCFYCNTLFKASPTVANYLISLTISAGRRTIAKRIGGCKDFLAKRARHMVTDLPQIS